MKLAYLFFWGVAFALILVAVTIPDKNTQDLMMTIVDLFLLIPVTISIIIFLLKGRKEKNEKV
jgi:hypothetical protein